MAQNVSKTTTDHDTIRRWAEERGGAPAEVASTASGAETGILRIDFPGYSGAGALRRISWDEWFSKFDDSGLAFVYQETTAGGERSSFNKLVSRETARARGGRASRRSAGTPSRAGGGRARTGAKSSRSARTRTGAKRAGKTARGTTRGGAGARKGATATARGSGRTTPARRQASRSAAARTAGSRSSRSATSRTKGGPRGGTSAGKRSGSRRSGGSRSRSR